MGSDPIRAWDRVTNLYDECIYQKSKQYQGQMHSFQILLKLTFQGINSIHVNFLIFSGKDGI